MNMNQPGRCLWKLLASLLATCVLAVGLTGCSTTKQVKETPKDFSGFLGTNYSILEKGQKGMVNYYYFDREADWAKYTKVYIENVDLWHSDETNSPLGKLSPENQQKLVNFLHTALDDSLKKNYEMVDHAGPDTLVIHCAITETKKSWPVLNLVSTVYPAALVISLGMQAITGTAPFVGKVCIEGKITDGETGELLMAAVDARAGTKALRSKFNGTWGDVKLVDEWWANRLNLRLQLLKTGDYGNKDL
jgi:Protein of unknown function (DUF3313)